MWALIIDGQVRELTSADPAAHFHVSMPWLECPEHTSVGDFYDGSDFARPAVPVPSLEDRRADLAAERYARETGGVLFQAGGAVAPSLAASDQVSQAKMTSSFLAATSGHWVDGTPWKMVDGSFVPLTAADMQALALRVLAYVAACYAHEAALSAALAVDLATDITQGWPANS